MSDTKTNNGLANALMIAGQTTGPVQFVEAIADTVLSGIVVSCGYAQEVIPDKADEATARTIQLILAKIFTAYPKETQQALLQMLSDARGAAQ